MSLNNTEDTMVASTTLEPAPPEPKASTVAVAPSSQSAHHDLQASFGNTLLAAAATGESPPDSARMLHGQPGYGNAAIAHKLIQRKANGNGSPGSSNAVVPATAPTETQATVDTGLTPAQVLIVEDNAETVKPGQMKKTEFLAQLRAAVCATAADAFADTPWSAAGCPYIDRWFAFYAAQDSLHLERAIRKYAPEASAVTNAGEFIPIVTARVRRSLKTFVTTGEITGVPEGVPVGLPGAGMMGAIGGAMSGAMSSVGNALSGVKNLLFKEREGGGGVETGDPEEIQSQLGAGHSLEGGVQSRMESAYGQSFGGVQVHADSKAAGLSESLNARAFTVGQDIAFGAGEYQPGTMIGDALIAHELAHVMQQRGADASGGVMQKSHAGYNALEEDADVSAVGAVLSTAGEKLSGIAGRTMPALRSGLRLQRCGPDVPEQTVNWQDLNRVEYEASAKKIRELHEQEKKLLAKSGWDDERSDQLAKIQLEIRAEVQKLQAMGIRRDAQDILKQLLQEASPDLLAVTGSLLGGEKPIYWGEKREFKLKLDYLPKDVDYYVWWAFNPGTQKQGIFGSKKLIKDLTVTLDEEFWAYWNKYGAADNQKAGKPPGFIMVADLFLGGGSDQPDVSFSTPQWINLVEDKVPTSIAINAPRVISLPASGAAAQPDQPAPTVDYVLQDTDIEFNLSWAVPVPGARNPKYGIQWSVLGPGSAPLYRGDSVAEEWKVSYNFPKVGKHIVGAEVYPLSKWTKKLDVPPVAKAQRELLSVSSEQLGKLALSQTEKNVPKIDYGDYVKDLDKQIADIEKMQQAGSAQGKELAQRLEDLKTMREKVLDQVGARGATLSFPEKEADFVDKATYVSNMSAVLSTPEYGGAFPLTVFVTMRKNGNFWGARITDTTTKDVIHWDGFATTPLAALERAIDSWRGSNEYPEKGTLHYSFQRSGWNLRGSFGLDTFKKSFWKWFDRILFVAQAIVALVLLLVPEPTGATKVAAFALLGIGILRSTYNIYNNLELGRPVLDQRNVLEAISIVASVVGIKGGMMMGAAGKTTALGEQLAGQALTSFRVGQGLVVMSTVTDVGTFVYIAADAIGQLQAAANDPSIPEAQRERHMMETYLRLFSQGLLILGSNAHLFQGAKPRGTNLGKFLESKAGADAEIKLDPSVRIRLQSEFRKINSEADVTTLSDRELVMGLQAVHFRAQAVKALNDIRDSLEGKSKDAFDRLRGEYKTPEEFKAAIEKEGDPKAFFAKLAADPAFMSKKVGADLPYAEQMQRLHSLDHESRVELAPSKSILVHEGGVDVAPDNLIRLNGQIDIHPSKLKEMPDADVKSLLNVTKALKDAKGDFSKLSEADQDALTAFAKSGGYRFRFEYHRQNALKQLTELGIESHPLFKDIPQEGQNRLFDLIAEGHMGGAPNLRKQAANWALSREPQSVREFVDLFQFYIQMFKARGDAKLAAFNAEVDKLQAAQPGVKREKIADDLAKKIGIKGKRPDFFRSQAEAEMAEGPGKLDQVNDAVRQEINAAYEKTISDPSAAIGKTQVDPALPRDQMVAKVKEQKTITFGSPSSIAYHSEKHYADLPLGEQVAGVSKVQAYMDSARLTVTSPDSTSVARAATGGGTSITFTREVILPGGKKQTMKAIVYVSLDGNVIILTYGK